MFSLAVFFSNFIIFFVVAMYGYSFCEAGRQAFKLLVSNALRVTVINSVGDFVLFLAKILIVGVTVFFGTNILQVFNISLFLQKVA